MTFWITYLLGLAGMVTIIGLCWWIVALVLEDDQPTAGGDQLPDWHPMLVSHGNLVESEDTL